MNKDIYKSRVKLKFWILPVLVTLSVLVMGRFGFDFSDDLTNMRIVTVDQAMEEYATIEQVLKDNNKIDRYEVLESDDKTISRFYVKNLEKDGLDEYDIQISKVFSEFPLTINDIVVTVLFGMFVQASVLYISYRRYLEPKLMFVFGLTNTFFVVSWWILVMGIVSLINFAGIQLTYFSVTGMVSTYFAGVIIMGWILLEAIQNKEEINISKLSEFFGEYLTSNLDKIFWQLLLLNIFALPLIGLVSFRLEVAILLTGLWLLFILIIFLYPVHLQLEKWFSKKQKSKKKLVK
jgi:hypothetical protein